MKKEKVVLEKIMLVGISARTNNKNEMDVATAKIGATLENYFSNHVPNHIQHRKNPGVTYSVYTNYESDEHGEYTYFIGEAVTSLDDQSPKLETLLIPVNTYQKFTTISGKMPGIVISAWQAIWKMDSETLGGKRNYIADFEIYDERAANPDHTIVDIYIGISHKAH